MTNETVFRELLGESLRREYAEFADAPEHKFTLRHRLAMRRIFARYERNVRALKEPRNVFIPNSATMPHYGIKQRVVIALVLVILMTLLTGRFFPIRGITDVQVDRLRSRYDFSSMKMTAARTSYVDESSGFEMFSIPGETDEYRGFLADLADMGIYSENELETLRAKPFPTDTRRDPGGTEHSAKISPLDGGAESPLDSYRDYVECLEEKIAYYTKRALEGDAEFAELIAGDYLPLPKSFLELLERLFAEEPENEDESLFKNLLDLDKDDRVYLL